MKHVFDEQGVQNSNDLNSQLGLPFVLCHNDLNASNVLWNKSTGQIQAVIDFQHISKGPVTFDIIRILCLGLSVEDRKRNTDKYVRPPHLQVIIELPDISATTSSPSNRISLRFPSLLINSFSLILFISTL